MLDSNTTAPLSAEQIISLIKYTQNSLQILWNTGPDALIGSAKHPRLGARFANALQSMEREGALRSLDINGLLNFRSEWIKVFAKEKSQLDALKAVRAELPEKLFVGVLRCTYPLRLRAESELIPASSDSITDGYLKPSEQVRLIPWGSRQYDHVGKLKMLRKLLEEAETLKMKVRTMKRKVTRGFSTLVHKDDFGRVARLLDLVDPIREDHYSEKFMKEWRCLRCEEPVTAAQKPAKCRGCGSADLR